jgi:Xaa-Pro aminopeptidase
MFSFWLISYQLENYFQPTQISKSRKQGDIEMDYKTYRERLKKCSSLLEKEGFDALLLVKPANMFYLTGDGRLCSFAMITQDGEVALGVPKTDVEDVKELAVFDHIVGFENEVGMIHSIAHYFKNFGINKGTVGLEYTFLTQSMMGMLTHPHAKPKEISVKDCTNVMSQLRMVKDNEEIKLIKGAAAVGDAGMKAAVESLKPGMTESNVAAEAEYAMRELGAEEFWRSYVCSGPRTNIAHGLPSNRKIQTGDLVMIDTHPIVNGYSADICRTVCVGKPNEEQQKAYDIYLEAQQETIKKVRSGADIGNLEKVLHTILQDAGRGEQIFGPPIHGVGIEFEEAPLPPGHAFFHGEKEAPPLPANVVLAVGNCGLYTGKFGVRVEDTVVVGKDGPEILTTYKRKLEI